jgi:hypothetical protein
MANVFQNIFPSSVNFKIDHHQSAYSVPPLDKPLPNNILPPGAQPHLPGSAIPANPGNMKAALNNLPSLFTLNHGNQ